MIVCTAELYGGWMTFCPEWIEGSPNLLPPGEYCLKFGFCSLEDGVMELWSFGGVMEL